MCIYVGVEKHQPLLHTVSLGGSMASSGYVNPRWSVDVSHSVPHMQYLHGLSVCAAHTYPSTFTICSQQEEEEEDSGA